MSKPPPYFLSPYKRTWTFYSVSLVSGILFLGSITFLYGYADSFKLLHLFWGELWDAAMPHLTHLADGAMIGGVFGLMYFKRKPELVLALLLSLILVAFTVAFLKQGVFSDWHRPASVLGLESVRLLSLGNETQLSFPSGHSAAAACLGWFIATVSTRSIWGFVAGIVAIFLGFTRVYIGVHFPGDVAAGLALGMCMAILGTFLVTKLQPFLSVKSQLFRQRLSSAIAFLSLIFLIAGIFNTLTKYYLS